MSKYHARLTLFPGRKFSRQEIFLFSRQEVFLAGNFPVPRQKVFPEEKFPCAYPENAVEYEKRIGE